MSVKVGSGRVGPNRARPLVVRNFRLDEDIPRFPASPVTNMKMNILVSEKVMVSPDRSNISSAKMLIKSEQHLRTKSVVMSESISKEMSSDTVVILGKKEKIKY